ncbi:DUF4476 domain-containing protein [Prevotella cerevisiae]|uniref:DUF4476 domain-containing protein n=1 Tax=Segatella cerevisiae TaxID=2053716 RepID=A0ABT1BV00_9BACT|nr:DUF4476 domain-containing protein [Segatella cerevisiae]MCO6024923.1 DUF4476 domain-containing protein [Segatella cerevisiae]
MAKDKRTVQRGMSKQEVMEILGKPRATSFNQYGEHWEYFKYGSFLDKYDDKILVDFDLNDRVINYQDILVTSDDVTVDNRTPATAPPYATLPSGGVPFPNRPYPVHCLDENEFSVLYRKVKAASFDDNKFDLIEVASLGGYYTCNQCARILELFPFANNQLTALKFMAHHIVDPQNAYSIYHLFQFNDDKEKAARIMQGR